MGNSSNENGENQPTNMQSNISSNSQRLEDFDRDGYVAAKPFFDADKVAKLNTEIVRYLRDVVPSMPD
ncbi:hypothetical protein A9Q96_10130 [Rhodobacterales bacterium 52_120_T64]|nr:hypothetical protein A9Q96_10130 [Rhodobacterales bacterium 52_120_T64]